MMHKKALNYEQEVNLYNLPAWKRQRPSQFVSQCMPVPRPHLHEDDLLIYSIKTERCELGFHPKKQKQETNGALEKQEE